MPVLGDLVGLLDDAATQFGFPFWFRTFAELVVAVVLTFILLRVLTAKLFPWLGGALAYPLTQLTRALLVLLLLPDLGASRLARRFGRTPPEIVYGYGSGVVAVVEGVDDLFKRALPKLSLTRTIRPWLLAVLLVIGFLLWNNQDCASGTAPQCASPVQVWLASFDQ
ncbi:hypothetical protein [Amycolatopsis sp. WQ 127309]|uniref:hypothetical protein n=1 Tax=Amycolatopsis sp. WQ 127309 TaxID=2932773 RepID=UPI001FF2F65E|nr:hypothetical protein [Amycolatopsis sp. WQ 127309]UOZ11329.1 hypothetical protein MUY22_24900 [Amycolatopsis sp. WQ 127309]